MDKNEYKVIDNSDGTKSLRRFNQEFNYWITIEFNDNIIHNKRNIIEILKKLYLEKNKL